MKINPFRANFESLDEFVEVISEALQCPITLEDSNHRLLAYSTHDERTDPARIATIIGRRVPEKVINNMWKEGIIPSLLSNRDPIRIKPMDEIGLGERVAVSIWKNDEVLGFIWALEVDRTLDADGLALLKRAAEEAKNQLLQVITRKNKKEGRHQEFFWQLLTSHFQTNEEIVGKFHSLQITPPTHFASVLFQFTHEITRNEEKKMVYLLNTIQELKILLYTIDHYKLILFISIQQTEQVLEKLNKFCELFIHKMDERYGVTSITYGFSGIYNDCLKIEKSYKEALTVLSIKEKFPSETEEIHSYPNLGIYQYIDVLLEKAKNDEYGNYAIKKLHDYDQKFNCNLVETLEVFLNFDSNIHDAAKILNVHSNTINYRLKRIAEIGEINLKDVNQKMTLFLELKLEKFLPHFSC